MVHDHLFMTEHENMLIKQYDIINVMNNMTNKRNVIRSRTGINIMHDNQLTQ